MLILAKWSQRLPVTEQPHLEERSSDSDLRPTAWIALRPAWLCVSCLTECSRGTETHLKHKSGNSSGIDRHGASTGEN